MQAIYHGTCVTKLESMVDDQRKAYEVKLEYKRVIHSNEVRLMHNPMNKLEQCLTALLALIETNPQKVQNAPRRVRMMREKQDASEVLEKATIAAAVTVAVAVPPQPSPNPTAP